MLQLLQLRGLFWGWACEDPHDHLQNFIDVCSLFKYWGVMQEAIKLRLFSFSIIGEAAKWLAELPQGSIASWKKLQNKLLERFFPPSWIVKLWRSIENFWWIDDEPLHEAWQWFWKLLFQCPNHGIPDHLMLQHFYLSLSIVNKSVADWLA